MSKNTWNGKTLKEFIKTLKSDIRCLDETELKDDQIIRLKDKYLFLCIDCNKEWIPKTVNHFIKREQRRCIKCQNIIKKNNLITPLSEILEFMKFNGSDIRVSKTVPLTDKNWEGIKKQYEIKCIDCGTWVKRSFEKFKYRKNYRCWECGVACRSISKTVTHLEYLQKLRDKNIDIEPLEVYIAMDTRIKHRCPSCGGDWLVTPISILQGRATVCPDCSKYTLKTDEKFKKDLVRVSHNEIIALEKYTNAKTPILVKHNIKNCDHEWYITPNNLLRGKNCPKCNESKGEIKIRLYLEINKISFKTQYKIENCRNINHLPFDSAVFDDNSTLKYLIEYDGEFHYEVARYSKDKEKMKQKLISQKYNDSIKTKYCLEHNIPLIRIPYWDFDNIEIILDQQLKDNIIEKKGMVI